MRDTGVLTPGCTVVAYFQTRCRNVLTDSIAETDLILKKLPRAPEAPGVLSVFQIRFVTDSESKPVCQAGYGVETASVDPSVALSVPIAA